MFFILFVLVICRLLRIAWLDSRRFCFSIYPHVNKSKYLTAILKSVWQRICSQLSLAQKAYLLMRLLYVCKFLKVFSLFIHLRAQFTLILLENLGLGIIQIKLNNCPIIGGEWGPMRVFYFIVPNVWGSDRYSDQKVMWISSKMNLSKLVSFIYLICSVGLP